MHTAHCTFGYSIHLFSLRIYNFFSSFTTRMNWCHSGFRSGSEFESEPKSAFQIHVSETNMKLMIDGLLKFVELCRRFWFQRIILNRIKNFAQKFIEIGKRNLNEVPVEDAFFVLFQYHGNPCGTINRMHCKWQTTLFSFCSRLRKTRKKKKKKKLGRGWMPRYSCVYSTYLFDGFHVYFFSVSFVYSLRFIVLSLW